MTNPVSQGSFTSNVAYDESNTEYMEVESNENSANQQTEFAENVPPNFTQVGGVFISNANNSKSAESFFDRYPYQTACIEHFEEWNQLNEKEKAEWLAVFLDNVEEKDDWLDAFNIVHTLVTKAFKDQYVPLFRNCYYSLMRMPQMTELTLEDLEGVGFALRNVYTVLGPCTIEYTDGDFSCSGFNYMTELEKNPCEHFLFPLSILTGNVSDFYKLLDGIKNQHFSEDLTYTINKLTSALQLFPYNIWARYAHIKCLILLNENEQAAQEIEDLVMDLNQTLQINPEQPFALKFRGILYHMQMKLQESLSDLDHALNLALENADHKILSEMAIVLLDMQLNDNAIAMLERIDESKQTSQSLIVRANLCMQKGEMNKALEHLNNVLNSAKDNFIAYGLRAKCQFFLGKYSLAMQDIETAMLFWPNNPIYVQMREYIRVFSSHFSGPLSTAATNSNSNFMDPKQARVREEMAQLEPPLGLHL